MNLIHNRKSVVSSRVIAVVLGMTVGLGAAATAAPILTSAPAAFAGSSVSFGFGGGAATYTLSSTGDIFNPVAVTTAGTALVNSFGGFLGIPITPTTNFIDRGTVTFGSTNPYTAFPATTTIPFSNGGNFLGLAFALPDGTHYGFAEFVDTNLIGYGFESTPGATITAVDLSALPVPEPAALTLLAAAFAALGLLKASKFVRRGAPQTA